MRSRNQAAQLLISRNKILDRLPEQFHEHRKAYPDYMLGAELGR